MQLKFILSLILSIVVAMFAIQNSAAVPVNFFIYHLEISQALIILISAIIGAIIAFSLGLMKQFSINKTIKEKDKKIHELEVSITKLELENAEQRNSLLISKEASMPIEPTVNNEPIITNEPIDPLL